MRILFIVPYPIEGPSNRLRVSQFLPYLKENGILCKERPFIFSGFYRILYLKGNHIKKGIFFLWSLLGRFTDIIRLLKYDIIFIHREACPLGPPFFEWIAYKFKKRIIFDFDDAIYLHSKSRSNNFIDHFKNSNKTAYIIKISDRVIAGNKFLSDFAMRFNKNVEIIPTCVDTDNYNNNDGNIKDALTIGWIGSTTTVEYLNELRNVFIKLAKKYPYLNFKIIGGEFKIDRFHAITNKRWRLEDEVSDLRSMDIGIMPMPDSDWARGKCGFKALLYMSMQIPCVCSSVGVNKEIVQDGINGFLASSEDEWIDKLSHLIDDVELRIRMGRAGRKTVEERFSVKVNAQKYLNIIKTL